MPDDVTITTDPDVRTTEHLEPVEPVVVTEEPISFMGETTSISEVTAREAAVEQEEQGEVKKPEKAEQAEPESEKPGEQAKQKAEAEAESRKQFGKSLRAKSREDRAARREAERRELDLRRQLEARDRELAELRAGKPAKAEAPAQPSTPAAPEPEKEAPKPQWDDFDDPAAFMDALTDWKLDQREKAAAAKQQAPAAQPQPATEPEPSEPEIEIPEEQQAWMDRVDEFVADAKTQFDDFEQTVLNKGNLPLTKTMVELAMQSDNGPAILHHLGKNPSEAGKIAGLESPMDVAREFVRIESDIAAAQVATSDDQPRPRQTRARTVSKAPEPITPVGGGAGGAGIERDLEELSQAEYEKARLGRRIIMD